MKYEIKKHGTNTAYSYGCRCDACKSAHANYNFETNKKYVNPDRLRKKVKTHKQILEESVASEPAYRFTGGKR